MTGSLQEAGLSDGDDESNDTCGSFLAKQYALSFHMCQVLASLLYNALSSPLTSHWPWQEGSVIVLFYE
jgi:hypothetical protein